METSSRIWGVLSRVSDPELPVLSIVDLGIVRYVRCDGESPPRVGITPTYSGCPATEVIRAAVQTALVGAGYADAVVEEVLSPPWTSEWLTQEGRRKLEAFGIAPPLGPDRAASHPIACPRCGSQSTRLVSHFGSTPCKAHYRCEACDEPFDYFKCL
ncbi:MAG TPA: 1,2-phenylacetyl-CoA epoxidase subunit PaaD [Steroidobacteraceae bacterium]|nr:1,2-phenylacetyl-CoA epoxidase subunit PaaD [Steroidobacteraceae bacterium]